MTKPSGPARPSFGSGHLPEPRRQTPLSRLTLRDPLTRLYNRRYFEGRLRSAFAFAERHGTLLGLLLVDIDHFEQVNDTCGHAVGDVVLKLVAGSIQKIIRPEDVLVRYGDTEFVVIVCATSLRNLEILGSRMCRRVAALAPDLAENAVTVTVTVSVGAACMGPDVPCASAEALLGAADQALHQAKTTGRNRVSTTRLSEQRPPR